MTGSTFESEGNSTADTVAYSSDGNELWVEYTFAYGATSLAVSPDGTRVYVGVSGELDECPYDAWCVVAYTSDGAEQWAAGFGRPCDDWVPSGPSDLTVNRDGSRIYVTGDTGVNCPKGRDYLTAALNSKGRRVWTRQYNGPGNGKDFAHALALSPAGGRLYVTGGSWGGSVTRYDYATIAYNTT